MAIRELNLTYEEFIYPDEIPAHIASLVEKAVEAAGKAYAPYSKFRVGAVVELANGVILSGNNQENAAYPSGICAERSSLFFANANFPETAVTRMVLVAFDHNGITVNPVYPCGACRQVLIETQDRFRNNIEIWMVGKKTVQKVNSVDTLLPLKFSWS